MKLLKAIIVCSVLSLPLLTSAAEIGTIRVLPGVGDADRDGWLTENDVTLIGKYLFEGITFPYPTQSVLDFNEDGRVSILDMQALAAVVHGFDHPMPALERQILIGDVNGDGVVTFQDAKDLFYHLYTSRELPRQADPASQDVNCDNRVDMTDVIQLVQQLHQQAS